MSAIFFGLFAGITVFSALAVAFQKNLVFAAFYLLVTFLGIASLYILLGADFLAVTQILIYVGGILILFLFGVLITKRKEKRYLISKVVNRKRSAFATIAIGGLLVYVVWKDKHLFSNTDIAQSSAHAIGFGLMGNYLLPFELAGILLLVILIGILAMSSTIKPQ